MSDALQSRFLNGIYFFPFKKPIFPGKIEKMLKISNYYIKTAIGRLYFWANIV